MKFFFAALLLVTGVRADELPPLDLFHYKKQKPEVPRPWPETSPVDECGVNTESALYHQTIAYLVGLRLKSDESSRWRPYVTQVCAGGEAEKAGVQEGDIIFSLTVVPVDRSRKATPWEVSSIDDVENTLFRDRGQRVETVVIRNEAKVTLPPLVPKTREREIASQKKAIPATSGSGEAL